MPTEIWHLRPPTQSATEWDDGETLWDEGIVPLAASASITTWDGEIGGETWTPRPPGTLP